MKVNITKADESAINESILTVRLAMKNGTIARSIGQKSINGLKKILEKHEIRKSKSY